MAAKQSARDGSSFRLWHRRCSNTVVRFVLPADVFHEVVCSCLFEVKTGRTALGSAASQSGRDEFKGRVGLDAG